MSEFAHPTGGPMRAAASLPLRSVPWVGRRPLVVLLLNIPTGPEERTWRNLDHGHPGSRNAFQDLGRRADRAATPTPPEEAGVVPRDRGPAGPGVPRGRHPSPRRVRVGGRVMTRRAPWPGPWLWARIVPPWAWTIARVMVSPIPLPPISGVWVRAG